MRIPDRFHGSRRRVRTSMEDVQSDMFDALTLASPTRQSLSRALTAIRDRAPVSRRCVPRSLRRQDRRGHLGDSRLSEEIEVRDQNTANGGRSYPGTAQAIEGGFEMKKDK